MDPRVKAFLDEYDNLCETLSHELIEGRAAYFGGTQYNDRELDAEGYISPKGQATGNYGSQMRTPAWRERRVDAVWNLRRETVEEITDWTCAGNFWCHLEIADDEAAEDWLNTLASQANLADTIAQARDDAGALGVGIVSFSVHKGRVIFETHSRTETFALSWADPVLHRPSIVVKCYLGENILAKRAEDMPVIARVWDERGEQYFTRRRNAQQQWEWVEGDRVEHGFGFCPVFWYPNNPRDGHHDGIPDGDGTEGLIDEANYLYAAAGATTKRNADDTLRVDPLPGANINGPIRKGGFNVIKAKSAEYITQDGASAEICMKVADARAAQVYRLSGVSKVESENLPPAASGELIRRLYQRTIKTAERHRRAIGRGLVVPLCEALLEVGRRLGPKGILLPPRVTEDAELGAKTVEQRTPGKSGFVTVIWPDHVTPTMDDLQKLVQSAVAGAGGKAVLSQRTAVAWVKTSPIPVTDVDAEVAAIASDNEAAAQHAANALGLAAEATGKAGTVGDEEKDEPPEGAAKDKGGGAQDAA